MNKKIFLVLIPLILLLSAPAVYFYTKYQKVSAELKKVSPQTKEDVAFLLQKVGSLMELPTDEEPTVATVTDKEKLKEQKFFSKAENDDKVIIYVKAQKAILYRPVWNKIIEVARVDTTDQNLAGTESNTATSSAVPSLTPTPNAVSMTVYNGTERVGLSNTFVEKIKDINTVKVTQKLMASKKDYVENLVIDLGGNNGEIAKNIADLIGNSKVLNKMPDGEATPSSQILVILGSNFN